MRRHHRHVLQMTMTTFFADRAVVRMVGHQKLDDRREEILGLFVGDRNERAVRCRRHARHDDAARLVALVAIRLDRSEEHTSELKYLMRISYTVFCLKKKIKK